MENIQAVLTRLADKQNPGIFTSVAQKQAEIEGPWPSMLMMVDDAWEKCVVIEPPRTPPELDSIARQAASTIGREVHVIEVSYKWVCSSAPRQPNYYEYLQSAEWRCKAIDAKEKAGWKCQVCNRPQSEVVLDAHHRTYARLGCERPEDITVLCRDCHSLYETERRSKNGQ